MAVENHLSVSATQGRKEDNVQNGNFKRIATFMNYVLHNHCRVTASRLDYVDMMLPRLAHKFISGDWEQVPDCERGPMFSFDGRRFEKSSEDNTSIWRLKKDLKLFSRIFAISLTNIGPYEQFETPFRIVSDIMAVHAGWSTTGWLDFCPASETPLSFLNEVHESAIDVFTDEADRRASFNASYMNSVYLEVKSPTCPPPEMLSLHVIYMNVHRSDGCSERFIFAA